MQWTPATYRVHRSWWGTDSTERTARNRKEIIHWCLNCKDIHNVIPSTSGGISYGYCSTCSEQMITKHSIANKGEEHGKKERV